MVSYKINNFTLTFIKEFNPQQDVDPDNKNRITGLVYSYSWQTGQETIVFDNVSQVEKFWFSERKKYFITSNQLFL